MYFCHVLEKSYHKSPNIKEAEFGEEVLQNNSASVMLSTFNRE